MKVGVVDIGTNSMRLLITSHDGEIGRWVKVTGLGRGVDATGRLGNEAIERTLIVLNRYGELMTANDVARRKAIATSASRDATNRESFFDRVEQALEVRPTLIDGHTEARYAYNGAVGKTSDVVVVSDIGGGSTEFVLADEEISIDIGSVRLGDRLLTDRPASAEQISAAKSHLRELFEPVTLDADKLVGVAGTWTALAAVDLGLDEYDREAVDGHELVMDRLAEIADRLADLDIEATREVPGLDPARAEAIFPGALVALGVMSHLGHDRAMVSERDTLDGVADELLGQ